MFGSPRRTVAAGRNTGGARRLASLALRRARQARARLAAAPSQERQLQHLTAWLIASAKGRPERIEEAKTALVDVLLGWTWDDVASRPDSHEIANELKTEAYL